MLWFSFWLYLGLLFSYLYEKFRKNIFFIYLTIFIMTLLAGFRTQYNDTERYIFNFLYITPSNLKDFFSNSDWYMLGNHPLFILFQTILKEYITTNPQIFILLTSIFINMSIIIFYKKLLRKYIYLALFLYVFSGLYMLGMAAIKQMLAISIGIWGIYFYLKGNKFLFLFFILIASLFHPYILLYLSVIFFDKDIWTKKIYLMILFTIAIGSSFNIFVSVFVENINNIGLNYNVGYIANAKSMNPFRVVFYSFIPIISYFYRKIIRNSEDKTLIVSINFSILTFVFMIMGLFGGANMFGRMGNYFEIFNYIAIVKIILLLKSNYKKILITFFLIVSYTIFFYYQYIYVRPFSYMHINFNLF